MPLQIIHRDITEMDCDCIVNPTDSSFSGNGGTDDCIHSKAGKNLKNFCRSLPPLHPGEVTVTPAFNLNAQYILHTVGPVWKNGKENETVILRSCYINALLKAVQLQCESVAFPLISAGTFGFPKDKVLHIATDAIADFFAASGYELDVTICILDKASYTVSDAADLHRFLSFFAIYNEEPKCKSGLAFRSRNIYEDADTVCSELRSYEDEDASVYQAAYTPSCSVGRIDNKKDSLSEWLKKQDDSFAVTLLKLIDKKGMTDVQCYKKANVSRKTFYKINNDKNYKPSKPTVLSFAISLELTIEETSHLLQTVGFSLSKCSTSDLIIEFFIRKGIYDIHEINAALYQYDQPCLGC